MDIYDRIIESDKFQKDLNKATPRSVGHRRQRINWPEIGVVLVLMLFAFTAGVIFYMRLTDGGAM